MRLTTVVLLTSSSCCGWSPREPSCGYSLRAWPIGVLWTSSVGPAHGYPPCYSFRTHRSRGSSGLFCIPTAEYLSICLKVYCCRGHFQASTHLFHLLTLLILSTSNSPDFCAQIFDFLFQLFDSVLGPQLHLMACVLHFP